ncbi:metallophosphoesterase family protein [Chitinispirillales bacterium ANBcel5]|uniref:metallophosphoesterase family protein n=1 Tax=Cellulosispirillum alkaliphilum TaxID=3039283 RepID=UPI002A578ECD|nr:metallophosphoesterase family protein [Chitinispirillales bacterium ANBcel5]
MKYAIISDIHANLEALEAVFEDIDKNETIDDVLCLGDIVGYGANPNECIELIKQRCPVSILGNHDAAAVDLLSTQHFNIHAKIAIEWTTKELKPKNKEYLTTLPSKKILDPITLVHSTPYEPNMWYYITSLEEAAFNYQYFDTSACFIGHTHIPVIIVLNKDDEVYVHQGSNYQVSGAERVLINVGSVGQPRDRNPNSSYGIFDTDTMEFSFRRVTYDIEKTQAKMRKIKMPEFLANRLVEGR